MKSFAKKIADMNGVAYTVGGCVRDEIMRLTPHDIDIVVCGITVEQFIKAFPQAKKTGISFPVFRITINNAEVEVAFARIEKKIDVGHNGFEMIFHPHVTIEEDLFRRDITMNAIAKNIITDEIIDPYNGISDIQNNVIRATSSHFCEDALRVLRVARFSTQFGFSIDDDTIELMKSCKNELQFIPMERIVNEMKKALSFNKPSIFFNVLKECDCLEVIFPYIHNLIGAEQPIQYHPEGDAYIHSMQVLDKVAEMTCDINVRFAALFHDIGKGLTPKEEYPKHYGHDFKGAQLIKELPSQFDNRMKVIAAFSAKNHMRVHKMSNASKIVNLLKDMKRKNISLNEFTPILLADHNSIPSWLNQDIIDCVFDSISIPSHITNAEHIKTFVQSEYIKRFKNCINK